MKELLKNKNVLILWISRALSRFGDAFESLALMYLVYDLTGSALAMGTIMIFSMVPNLVVSPLAGVIVDRYNKKVVMFFSELVRTILILAIPVLMYFKVIEFWHICAIAVGVSIAESFYEPCSGVVFKLIVSDDQLPLLNSLSTTTNSIMRMIGYSLSTTAMVFLGKEIIFIIDSATFLISAIAALLMTIPVLKVDKLDSYKQVFTDFKEGLDYVKAKKFILVILAAYFIIDGVGTPVTEFMPILTGEMLKINAAWAGYLLTITSVGTIVGSILYPILVKFKLTLESIFFMGFVLLGAVMLVPCFLPHYITAIVLFFIFGVISPIISSWGMTYVQINTDVKYLGRVSSVMNIAILSSVPLAGALVGWGVDVLSLKNIIEIAAAISIISGMILYKIFKKCKVVKEVKAEPIVS